MNVYLASRYSRRLELCQYRAELLASDFVVTSRWLDGNHQISRDGHPIGDNGEALVEHGDCEEAARLRAEFAEEDFTDVCRSGLLIAFAEPPRSNASRGGRHVELGLALGMNKDVIVVGYRENIFCWLPNVAFAENWEQAYLMARIIRTSRGYFDAFSMSSLTVNALQAVARKCHSQANP